MKKRTLVILMCIFTLAALCLAFASCGDAKNDEKSCLEGGTKHDWSRWETINATCGAPSQRIRECYDCGEVEENQNYTPTPATGAHNFVNYICTVCGQVSPNRPNCDQGGSVHDWEILSTTAATCISPGRQTVKCRLCNTPDTIEVESALGHIWTDPVMGVLQLERTCQRPGCNTKQTRTMKNLSLSAELIVEGGGWGINAGDVNNGNWNSGGTAFAGTGSFELILSSPSKVDQIAVACSSGSFRIEVVTNKSAGEYIYFAAGAGEGNSKEAAQVFSVEEALGDSDVLIISVKVYQVTEANGTITWGEIAIGQIDESKDW